MVNAWHLVLGLHCTLTIAQPRAQVNKIAGIAPGNSTHRREYALLRVKHPLEELLGVVRVMETVHGLVHSAQ
jgi:hypothetical protein